MDLRYLYAVGFGLAVVGSLAAVAGMVLAGEAPIGVIALGATVTLVLALRNVFEKEAFDRDHSLGYRVVDFGGALFVLALGLLMLVVGAAALNAFA